MRQRFFIFVQCKPGKTYEVGLAIVGRKLPYIADVSSISGKWDLLIRAEIDNREDIGRQIGEELIEIGGIKRTKTVIGYGIVDPDEVFFPDD